MGDDAHPVSMLGPPPEIGTPPLALLLRQIQPRDGSRIVLRLVRTPDAWADGLALAAAVNAMCDVVGVRRRTDDDKIIDRARGHVHLAMGSAVLRAPPGHNDRDPDMIEFHCGSDRLEMAEHIVAFELKPMVPWADGERLAQRIKTLCSRIDVLPRHG